MADIHPVPAGWSDTAIDEEERSRLVERAKTDPDTHWRALADRLEWVAPYATVSDCSFDHPVRIRWYEGGRLNVAANCLDRHLASRGDHPAIVWEPDDPAAEPRTLTFLELHEQVCRFANALTARGVAKGDRVTLYMPMVPEAAVAMLACARIGAVHSVVFGGFSPDALAGRIRDCDSRVVVTADEGLRAGKPIPLKANVDAALKGVEVDTVFVLRRTGADVPRVAGRDLDWHEAVAAAPAHHDPVAMGAEDPLFVLYTSGSTGAPKGVLHTTGGYLAWAAWTHELVFDAAADDVFWCTADVGWITGHSYVVYGPLANGMTTVMFEGVPTWPTSSRMWEVVDRHRVTTLYTAPTAIRALMAEGDAPVARTDRSSLRLLGSVGEPINPEAWEWYWRVVGDERCPVIDSWWQTETGGILIAPLPGATDLKPGSATLPLPGVHPILVDAEGRELEGEATGNLCLTASWPGQARTLWGDHARFEQTYFSTYPGRYFTGDGCRRDADGYYWITGRVDDVINVSGHRLGTAEVESALVSHPDVAEAAVVGRPHDVKGQALYAFVTPNVGVEGDGGLRTALIDTVRAQIGPLASPDAIQFTPALPKTRSGKIMRRILRKVAGGDVAALGDTSTLADPEVVDALVKGRVA